MHLYGRDPSLDKDWLYQYLFVSHVGDQTYTFEEVGLHAQLLSIKTPNPGGISSDDMNILWEIHKDFGHKHDF